MSKNFLAYKKVQAEANKKGLNMWETGGYYRLSGLDKGGNHIQGEFTSLTAVKKQLKNNTISRR